MLTATSVVTAIANLRVVYNVIYLPIVFTKTTGMKRKIAALIRMILESPGVFLLAIGEHQTALAYTNVLISTCALLLATGFSRSELFERRRPALPHFAIWAWFQDFLLIPRPYNTLWLHRCRYCPLQRWWFPHFMKSRGNFRMLWETQVTRMHVPEATSTSSNSILINRPCGSSCPNFLGKQPHDIHRCSCLISLLLPSRGHSSYSIRRLHLFSSTVMCYLRGRCKEHGIESWHLDSHSSSWPCTTNMVWLK